ncbi:hypothetical protein [Chryseobacterium lathyri]|uniref:Uncharacterized protein n=1 Tax=Chryseobacterium lathyri TaxID=395933 RepID=A0ABT9SS28_9FLAO|nr:hypothetical protein [Chryseobacterium lathyri]MDP9962239.1 hypothetical protein [Chryseobacterium lathyri]
MKSPLLIACVLLLSNYLKAQEPPSPEFKNPPVVVEVLAGNNGYASQMTVNKSFRSFPKLGIFSVTNFSSRWSETNSKDMMNQIHLTYHFAKGFSVLAGTHYTPSSGLRPNTALMYSYSSKEFLVTLMPRIDLANNSNWEGFALVEYKPKLNEFWNLYTRAQGLYCATINSGDHARSYLMLRVGISSKEFRFGLGANWDAYGPARNTKANYGVFVAANVIN